MKKFRKSRSTAEGRQSAYERMKQALSEVKDMTDDQLRDKISGLLHFSLCGDHTRERLVIMYAEELAKFIVDA